MAHKRNIMKKRPKVFNLPFFNELTNCRSDSCGNKNIIKKDSVPIWCQYILELQGLIMSVNKERYPYREAVLSDNKGDISKKWYVNYYVWSEMKNELVRKRSVFDQPKAKERYKEATEFINVINEALREGRIVDEIINTTNEISHRSTINEGIEFFLMHKERTVSANTFKTYRRDIKVFQTWIENNGLVNLQLQKFETKHVFAFSDYLDVKVNENTKKVGISKKTFSNFITTLRTMWTLFTEREILSLNPFLKVKKRKGRPGQHIPYSHDQIKIFKKECLEKIGDEQLWLFVNFIYYGFFRPAEEAQQLQVKHILQKTIVVPGSIAKNNLTEYVRIPKPLEKLIVDFNLRSYPPNYYIFSRLGKPGPKSLGREYMYTHNRKVLKSAKLTDQDYDLYGWKHTGVIALYLATKDIKLIQIQCRHKDINTTDKYLRELGMFLDENALDLFPEAGLD